MEKVLIYIKHHLGFLWRIVEWVNGSIFFLLFNSKMQKVLQEVISEFISHPIAYRVLIESDAQELANLINSQEAEDLKYFNPHGFDKVSLRKQFKNPAFLMLGSFDGNILIGYFFLRFFANKKCFVGRIIDRPYRGIGIGAVMNRIMYETAWRMGFRCLSTISKNNQLVISAHAKNPSMKVLSELPEDYLLVEFVREKTKL